MKPGSPDAKIPWNSTSASQSLSAKTSSGEMEFPVGKLLGSCGSAWSNLVKLEGTSPTNTQHSLFVPTAIARGSSLSQDGRHRRRGIQRRFNHQNPTGAMDKVPDSHWRKIRQEQPPRADEGDEGGPWIYRNVGRGPSRRSTPHWH